MSVSEKFEKYCENIKLQRQLDDCLFETRDEEKWKENLIGRAKKLRDINRENGEILDSLQRMFTGDLSEKDAGEMLNACVSTIIEGFSDAALHYPLLLSLADYFEAADNLEAYITAVFYAGFVEGEILFRSGAQEEVSSSLDEKVVAQAGRYAEIEDVNVRSMFLMSFHNLSMCTVMGREQFGQAYEWLLKMEEFWQSDEVQRIDGDNEMFIEYMRSTRRLWLGLGFTKEDKGTPACDYWCASAKEHFEEMEKETGGDVKNYLIQTYGPYLNSLVVRGQLTYREAADLFYVRYRDYMDQALNGRDEMAFICFGLIPTVNALTDMADKADEASKKYYYDIVNRDVSDLGKRHYKETQVDSALNQMLAELCVKSISLAGSKEEKEKALFNLVIKRQLPTYLHSMMTTRIAGILSDFMWDCLPGYFEGTGISSKEELVHFVEQAARLHDLGKIHITDIVNMQRRRLDEEEFRGIRRHPGLGAKVIESDPDLSEYADIILGHHKSYDGKGGYPATFDNTASSKRRLIDIVTLADCIDAATDRFSRNYKPAKTIPELIGEFSEGAGTRYNPDMVKLLCENIDLQKKLEEVTDKERLTMMYEAYSAGREMYI